MALKDEQLMAIQHVYNGKDMLRVCYWIQQIHTSYDFSPFVFMPGIHFGKAEASYQHHRLGNDGSTWSSCTLQSCILLNILSVVYLRVQLSYLDELH